MCFEFFLVAAGVVLGAFDVRLGAIEETRISAITADNATADAALPAYLTFLDLAFLDRVCKKICFSADLVGGFIRVLRNLIATGLLGGGGGGGSQFALALFINLFRGDTITIQLVSLQPLFVESPVDWTLGIIDSATDPPTIFQLFQLAISVPVTARVLHDIRSPVVALGSPRLVQATAVVNRVDCRVHDVRLFQLVPNKVPPSGVQIDIFAEFLI